MSKVTELTDGRATQMVPRADPSPLSKLSDFVGNVFVWGKCFYGLFPSEVILNKREIRDGG